MLIRDFALAVSPRPTHYAYTKCGSLFKSDQNEMVSFIGQLC